MKTHLVLLSMVVAAQLHAQTSDSARHYYQLAQQAAAERKFGVASAHFEKSISFQASSTVYLDWARTLVSMRQLDQAKALYVKVLELEPRQPQAMTALLDMYFNFRQYTQAIELAKICSSCEQAERIMGISYYQQEDFGQAEKHLLLALQRNPEDAEATYTLARTYLDGEQYSAALPVYEKAVLMAPNKSNWTYELGLLYYTLNDYRKAMNAFQDAADHGYIQSNDFKENLGYACMYSGEFDKGEALLLSIWQKKPGNKDILRDVAEIYYQQKQFDKSLDFCQKLLEIDGKDGKALYQAGLCFQKKGQKDRGQQMCDKAIELDPSLASLRREKKMPGGL